MEVDDRHQLRDHATVTVVVAGAAPEVATQQRLVELRDTFERIDTACGGHQYLRVDVGRDDLDRRRQPAGGFGGADRDRIRFLAGRGRRAPDPLRTIARQRSEEHTSELQSLMRISYAVFCLKNKKIIIIYY